MTIVIKRTDTKEAKQKKLDKLQKISLKRNSQSFMKFCGALKGVFKEDAVVIQRKLRAEWD